MAKSLDKGPHVPGSLRLKGWQSTTGLGMTQIGQAGKYRELCVTLKNNC